RERRQIVRALLETRQRLHQALFHCLLDVITTACGFESRETVVEDPRHRRRGLLTQRNGAPEIALLQQRDDLTPQLAVARARHCQIDPTLDRDRHSRGEHERNGVHESTALHKELNDRRVHDSSETRSLTDRHNALHSRGGDVDCVASAPSFTVSKYVTSRRKTSRSTGVSTSSSKVLKGCAGRSPRSAFFHGTI